LVESKTWLPFQQIPQGNLEEEEEGDSKLRKMW
jgi:hypothetical protein